MSPASAANSERSRPKFRAAGSIAAASTQSNPPLSMRHPLKTGAALAFGDQIRFGGARGGQLQLGPLARTSGRLQFGRVE